MDTINKELKNKAVSLGLCDGWQKMWNDNKTAQELIDMYKKGIDFAFAKNYPANEFIKENFDPKLLHENNMFVDDWFDRLNPENSCVILGKSRGVLTFDNFSTCDIYIKDESEVKITASGFAKIFVNVYGNSQVLLFQKEKADIYVYRHGDCEIFCDGNVIVRDSGD